jgi:plastocyanin
MQQKKGQVMIIISIIAIISILLVGWFVFFYSGDKTEVTNELKEDSGKALEAVGDKLQKDNDKEELPINEEENHDHEEGEEHDHEHETTEEDEESANPETTPTQELEEADITFTLTGKNFEYNNEEGESNPTLTVQEGDVVRIEYTTESGFHDFVIEEFEGATTEKVRSEAGTQTIQFTANKKGSFEYYCSVGSHKEQGMKGAFIVE